MANHHERGTSKCPLCEEKLLQGHPVIQKWFKAIKAFKPEVHTSWVWRGEADQNQFYKDGKSRALFPHSKHNTTLDGEPCARAMDLFFIRPDGVPSWSEPDFSLVASFLVAKQAPLVWGGTWPGNLRDLDHFQLADSVIQNEA